MFLSPLKWVHRWCGRMALFQNFKKTGLSVISVCLFIIALSFMFLANERGSLKNLLLREGFACGAFFDLLDLGREGGNEEKIESDLCGKELDDPANGNAPVPGSYHHPGQRRNLETWLWPPRTGGVWSGLAVFLLWKLFVQGGAALAVTLVSFPAGSRILAD